LRPVATAKRAGSRFCQIAPAGGSRLQFEIPRRWKRNATAHGYETRGRRHCGNFRPGCTLRGPAAVDENDATVGKQERRHDRVPRAPSMDLVVDQDLPGRNELAGRDHGQIAQRRPIGIVGECRERNRVRTRGVIELGTKRLFGVETLALPVPGRDAHDDRGNRDERGAAGASC
jgi:hypothetical protein